MLLIIQLKSWADRTCESVQIFTNFHEYAESDIALLDMKQNETGYHARAIFNSFQKLICQVEPFFTLDEKQSIVSYSH